MADQRKSAKQTDARRRAREKAAKFRELQDTLEQLATDYFVVVDSIEEMNEDTEREIAKLRERAAKQSQKAHHDADQVIVRMVDAGASPAEVADRLGISARDIKKATRVTPVPAQGGSATPSQADTRDGELGAGEPNAGQDGDEQEAA